MNHHILQLQGFEMHPGVHGMGTVILIEKPETVEGRSAVPER